MPAFGRGGDFEDVKSGEKEGINDVGSRVQEDGVAKLHALEDGVRPEEDEFEKEILFGKGIAALSRRGALFS